MGQRLIAMGLVLAVASPALAQAPNAPQDLALATLESLLDIEITTATRGAEGVGGAPARVQVVTAAQIERRGYRSLLDVLKDLPDFKVDLAGDADYPTELVVQGTRGAGLVVLLLDGVRISSPTNEPLPILANYPVHTARQVEIVYGPASAVYGADAFSAVINIISKTGAEAQGFAANASIGQYGVYHQSGSFGSRLGSNASLMVSGQVQYDRQPDLSRFYPTDYQGLASHRTGTFNTIFGPMTPQQGVSPDYEIPLSAHSAQATLRSGGLQMMLFESHARISTTPATTPENAVYNPDAFNLNRLLVTSIGYSRPVGAMTSTSSLTWSRHELDPNSGYWNVYSNLKRSFKYAYGRMAKAEEQLSLRLSRTLSLTTGGTFEHFFSIPQGADLNSPVRSQAEPGTILDTNIPDAFVKLRYTNTGAFAQAQYALAPPITITIGGRGDYNSRYGATFNPRAGVVLRPRPGTTVKTLYGSAYLAPSPYQSFSHYGSFYSADGGTSYASSYWHLGNAALKPQQKKTVEVNLLQSLGESFQLSASAFRSQFTNLVKSADADRAYAGDYLGWPVDYIDFPVNEGRAYTYGGAVGLDFLHLRGSERRIAANIALSLADGRVWEEDEWESDVSLPIGAMAPVQVRAGADVDWRSWSIAPRLAVVGAQRLLATSGEGSSAVRRTLPGYATVDLTLRRLRVLRGVDAFLTIENALDARYRHINSRAYTNPEELIGVPQNPRRITVGITVRTR